MSSSENSSCAKLLCCHGDDLYDDDDDDDDIDVYDDDDDDDDVKGSSRHIPNKCAPHQNTTYQNEQVRGIGVVSDILFQKAE